MWFMGLDIGTTVVKAALFDENAKPVQAASEGVRIFHPAEGAAEQDAEAVFQTLLRVMARAAEGHGEKVGALSLSVQGDAVIPTDRNGCAVGPAQLGMDYRSLPQTEAFEREFGAKEIFSLTGMRPHPMNSLCKIRYIRECCPEISKRAERFMTYSDYILYRLGSEEPVIDLTMATRTMAMALSTGEWDAALLYAAGISPAMLSRPIASGQPVGRLRKETAEQTGLTARPILVSGGYDQVCAAVGAGIGDGTHAALDSHGTAEVVSVVLDRPMLSDSLFEGFLPCYHYAEPNRFFTFSLNHTGGLLLQWFAEKFCGQAAGIPPAEGVSIYDELINGAPDAPTGLLILPYLNGQGTPHCDPAMKGLIAGLTLQTDRFEMAKGILESLAYEVRTNMEAMRGAKIRIDSIRCVGGGARSPARLRLKADIYGCPVTTLRVREAACLGAALLAGIGTGFYASMKEAESLVAPAAVYEPNASIVKIYDEKYSAFQHLYSLNREFLRRRF